MPKRSVAPRTQIRDRIQGLKRLDPSQIVDNAKNFRLHPEAQKNALGAMLKKVGIVDAVIVRQLSGGKYELIDGHLRRSVIGQKIPALVVDLNDAEAAEVLASFDAIGDLAEIDETALRALVQDFDPGPEIAAMLADLAGGEPLDFGAAREEGEKVAAGDAASGDGELPPIPTDALIAKWGTAPGQLWVVPSLTMPGREHRLLCGDCRDPANVARLHEGARPKLGLHDPPYGIDIVARDGKAGLGDGKKPGRSATAHGVFAPIEGDTITPSVAHVLGTAAILVLWGANNYPAELPPSNAWIVWDKRTAANGEPATPNAFGEAELAFVLEGAGRKRIRIIRHLWAGMYRASEHRDPRLHPTQKPIKAQGEIVEWYTEPGDLVADWYMGAGAVGLACEERGRIFHGMDVARAYLAATIERFAQRGLKPRLVE